MLAYKEPEVTSSIASKSQLYLPLIYHDGWTAWQWRSENRNFQSCLKHPSNNLNNWTCTKSAWEVT